MESWHLWFIFALVLGILEIFVPGLTIICLCGGSIAAGIACYLGASFLYQLGLFSIISLILFFLIRPLILTLFNNKKDPDKETNVNALIGKKGKVIKNIIGEEKIGWVKLINEEWAAINVDKSEIELNEEVIVKEIKGNTLVVEKVNKQ